MTDRELLELAAKAAAYDVRWHENWQCFVHVGVVNINTPPTLAGQRQVWNPLGDDGDALRLAVRLAMLVRQEPSIVTAGWSDDCPYGGPWFWKEWVADQDHYEATRRAIVCAAAKIGSGVP